MRLSIVTALTVLLALPAYAAEKAAETAKGSFKHNESASETPKLPPSSKGVSETYGAFQDLCVRAQGRVSLKQGPLPSLLKKGLAKELSVGELKGYGSAQKGWRFSQEDRKYVLLQQANACQLYSDQGTADEMQRNMPYLVSWASRNLGATSKPLADSTSDGRTVKSYQLSVADANPRQLSLATTDTPTSGPHHILTYTLEKK